jgi:hypothetical protein
LLTSASPQSAHRRRRGFHPAFYYEQKEFLLHFVPIYRIFSTITENPVQADYLPGLPGVAFVAGRLIITPTLRQRLKHNFYWRF